MFKYSLFALFLLGFSCSKKLKIVENEQVLATIESFPKNDTTIMVKDFFIRYRGDGPYIVGEVESPFADVHGIFKSTKSTTIDISDGKFAIY
jgi:hypothetical protein